MGVGLRRRRGIFGEGCAEIAEARRRDRPNRRRREGACKQETLVVAAAGAMDDQGGNPSAFARILDRSQFRCYDRSAVANPFADIADVAPIAGERGLPGELGDRHRGSGEPAYQQGLGATPHRE